MQRTLCYVHSDLTRTAMYTAASTCYYSAVCSACMVGLHTELRANSIAKETIPGNTELCCAVQ
jgi:hypothetical protein